ncbi:hypothetical protein [Streptomyces sp. NPDC041003]|uniref:hypothetical protein n=1 Tax=Streptomyces sp. NPDC041003 TaxID=3155730 RepID=UPI0033EEEB00
MPTGQKTTQDAGNAPEEKKLDLSAAQVAGSSLATVAAALLASKMGVYGTILGAGVVSVVATAGGPVIQHFFRRTGDQLRESARTGIRRVPQPREEREAAGAVTAPHAAAAAAAASGAAFVLAIGGLGTYEAMAGTSVSSDGGTLFSGGTRKAGQDRPSTPWDEPAGGGTGGRTPGSGTSPGSPRPPGSPSPGTSRGPSTGPGPSGSGEPTPGPSPSQQTPTPTPAPPTPPPSPDASPPAARQSPP